jgi:short-subunit dehydrogenase
MYANSIRQIALEKYGVQIIDLYPGAINTGMSKNRKDKNKLIDSKELASFVVSLTKFKTMVPNSIIVQRTRYC